MSALIVPVCLLEVLRVRGFTPDEGGEWFDLPLGGRKVRVTFDDNVVAVHVLSANGVSFWQVTLSDGTPRGVIAAVIDLAVTHVVTARGLAWG